LPEARSDRRQIVVAGAGVAALASALFLARAGHQVTLVERDALEAPDSWASALTWTRRGIPHFHQPHAFIPRGRKALRQAAPDVYAALLEAGASEVDVGRKIPGERRPEDDDLVYLSVRRPVIEWGLRRAVLAEPRVAVRAGVRVVGLVGEAGPLPRIHGVRPRPARP
jgi:2-polyprenyl-6-methoxyphenol hydroxylase-like FAD-dependent oxidoreductase